MSQKAETGDAIQKYLRGPALEQVHHHRQTTQQKQETHHHAENEGHDLVAGQRRHA